MTERVQEILSWYDGENIGVRTNLARILGHGRLAGSGRAVILPVDQGFEHGPARSFAPNPASYDPRYHFRLAIESGCNAHAAPLILMASNVAAAKDRELWENDYATNQKAYEKIEELERQIKTIAEQNQELLKLMLEQKNRANPAQK